MPRRTSSSAVLLFAVPGNDRWNQQWLHVVTGRVSTEELSSLPTGMQGAARLVLAAHAEQSGHAEAARALLEGVAPDEAAQRAFEGALEDVTLRTYLQQLRASEPGRLPEPPW
jgi:hypothetical protein